VGRCLPHMWGFHVGRIKNPPKKFGGRYEIRYAP
jgi:hypothetical protein